MADVLDDLKAVHKINGATYSSMEVLGMIGRAIVEIEDLHRLAEMCLLAIDKYRFEIERLRAALKPFADAVYNDNGDMTITPCDIDAYAKAYFVMRRDPEQPDARTRHF